MYINLAGTWLTNPNDGTSERLVTSSRELAINGKILVQQGNPIRAISAALFARGNLTHSIAFKVTRRFTTIAAAYSFAASHRSLLPTSGELLLTCGLRSEAQIICRSENAVLSECGWDSADTPGVSITHTYSLLSEEITILPPPGAGWVDSTGAAMVDSSNTQMTGS